MAIGKNWWCYFAVAGGKRWGKNKPRSTAKFWHHHRFQNNVIGMIYPKKLYPTPKHLPTFRRNIDVFADLRT